MDVQKALVHIGACESYKESAELLISGVILLNGKRIDAPWYQLKGGYYALKVKGRGLYRFNIRRGKVDKIKVKLKEASE
jgi:ribosomal protein S4